MLLCRAGFTPSAGLSCCHRGTLTLSRDRQSAPMSKITSDDLTQSGTGCFIAVPI